MVKAVPWLEQEKGGLYTCPCACVFLRLHNLKNPKASTGYGDSLLSKVVTSAPLEVILICKGLGWV